MSEELLSSAMIELEFSPQSRSRKQRGIKLKNKQENFLTLHVNNKLIKLPHKVEEEDKIYQEKIRLFLDDLYGRIDKMTHLSSELETEILSNQR